MGGVPTPPQYCTRAGGDAPAPNIYTAYVIILPPNMFMHVGTPNMGDWFSTPL